MPETAAELRIGRNTLFRLMRNGDIVPIRILGRTLFERVELERFVASRRAHSQRRSGP